MKEKGKIKFEKIVNILNIAYLTLLVILIIVNVRSYRRYKDFYYLFYTSTNFKLIVIQVINDFVNYFRDIMNIDKLFAVSGFFIVPFVFITNGWAYKIIKKDKYKIIAIIASIWLGVLFYIKYWI